VDFTKIAYTVEDAVATITLNDPERRNPLSPAMLTELGRALDQSKHDPDVRVVVLTGAGAKAFSAGADLTSFTSGSSDPPADNKDVFVNVFVATTQLGKPLIGAINGHALAGGFGLALCCDLLIVSDAATFGTPEIKVGVWPMMIMSIVTRNLGRKRALELFMTGRRIDAQTAADWGIANRVVAQEQVLPEAQALAAELAQWSSSVMRLGRDAFYASESMEYEPALRYLQEQLALVLQTEDAREGVLAFLEKRSPNFSGK
jgi:enoyl-CoA hydratase/carnithine racemase